jgi:GT2 family glycosyltransferase
MDLIAGKTFVICIPGRQFSSEFMLNLIELVAFISRHGGNFKLSVQYLPVINASRCKCLAADLANGKKQKPFNEIQYDYILWIDSDVIFNNDAFLKLLQMDKTIASGWYAQPSQALDGTMFTPVVEHADPEYFKKNITYKFMTVKDMSKKKKPFTVDHIGFGWVLIKQGVFETLEYPWFAPRMQTAGEFQDLCSEDVAFCLDAQKAGYEIWLDPACRVGHEKQLVI